jgi:cation diffusion facilitator CzcD-associated flavoprotein CzcO
VVERAQDADSGQILPSTPIDLRGKRVALVGAGSSGVQIVPAIADEVAEPTVYQRTADRLTPPDNAPITPEEQAGLKADFEAVRAKPNRSPSGFLHTITRRSGLDDSPEQREEFYEQRWNGPGFTKLSEHHMDMTTNQAVNEEWCRFIARKVRGIVKDPRTAEQPIPKDHGYGGRRPPFGTGCHETYNRPNVHLADLEETPITRITETGIATSRGTREFDIVIWATGYDSGTGALKRLGVRGRRGIALEDYWADGPRTYLGTTAAGFPNFFFPGGPHRALGNNPRHSGDQVDFVTDALIYTRGHGQDVIETDPAAEQKWTDLVNASGSQSSFLASSYFHGANIPGKPVAQMLNPTGRRTLRKMIADVAESDYATFVFSRLSGFSGFSEL